MTKADVQIFTSKYFDRFIDAFCYPIEAKIKPERQYYGDRKEIAQTTYNCKILSVSEYLEEECAAVNPFQELFP